MKIREMDIYFTVPVDFEHLAACRERAGYKTTMQFQRELANRGYSLAYVSIERNHGCKGPTGNRKIRGDVAELIAEVVGLSPSEVFPQYNTAKTAAELEVNEQYYKPFTTVEGRNAAIVNAMDAVKWTALKYCRILKDQNGVHFLEQEDILSIAYETLVHMADRAMKKGIHKGASFDAAACVAVKQEFLRRGKENGSKGRKADVVSWEAIYSIFEQKHSGYDFVDHLILRDEVLRAVRGLSEEKQRDKRIQQLIAECFPMGVTLGA